MFEDLLCTRYRAVLTIAASKPLHVWHFVAYRDYWGQQVPKSKLTRYSGDWVRELASSLWPEKGLRKERKGGTNQLGGPYWLDKIGENLSKRSCHSIFFLKKYLNFEAFINPLIFFFRLKNHLHLPA